MGLNKETIIAVAKEANNEIETYEFRNQLTLIVQPNHLIETAKHLKESSSTDFDMLLDITAIDWARPGKRFEVVYFLYSNQNKTRVRIKCQLEGEYPECPSMTGVWESANWYERETYDMYGIKFTGHPFLRRFYMPEDFVDQETGEPLYPLRKEFPLAGIPDTLPLPPYPEKYGDIK